MTSVPEEYMSYRCDQCRKEVRVDRGTWPSGWYTLVIIAPNTAHGARHSIQARNRNEGHACSVGCARQLCRRWLA